MRRRNSRDNKSYSDSSISPFSRPRPPVYTATHIDRQARSDFREKPSFWPAVPPRESERARGRNRENEKLATRRGASLLRHCITHYLMDVSRFVSGRLINRRPSPRLYIRSSSSSSSSRCSLSFSLSLPLSVPLQRSVAA